MNNQNDIQKLMAKYPNLYRDSKIRHGFYVGDGWLPLIDTLSAILESEIKDMPEDIKGHFFVVQVKEKFGTLRFYLEHSTPFLDGAISMAESMSARTCEECGLPGSLRNGSWIKTKCDSCFQKFIEKKHNIPNK